MTAHPPEPSKSVFQSFADDMKAEGFRMSAFQGRFQKQRAIKHFYRLHEACSEPLLHLSQYLLETEDGIAKEEAATTAVDIVANAEYMAWHMRRDKTLKTPEALFKRLYLATRNQTYNLHLSLQMPEADLEKGPRVVPGAVCLLEEGLPDPRYIKGVENAMIRASVLRYVKQEYLATQQAKIVTLSQDKEQNREEPFFEPSSRRQSLLRFLP